MKIYIVLIYNKRTKFHLSMSFYDEKKADDFIIRNKCFDKLNEEENLWLYHSIIVFI